MSKRKNINFSSLKFKNIVFLLIIISVVGAIGFFSINYKIDNFSNKKSSEAAITTGRVISANLKEKYIDTIMAVQKNGANESDRIVGYVNDFLYKIKEKISCKNIYTLYLSSEEDILYGFDASASYLSDVRLSSFKLGTNYKDIVEDDSIIECLLEDTEDKSFSPILNNMGNESTILSYIYSLDSANNVEFILVIENDLNEAMAEKRNLMNIFLLIFILILFVTLLGNYLFLNYILKRNSKILDYSYEIQRNDLSRHEEYFENDELGIIHKNIFKSIGSIKKLIMNIKNLCANNHMEVKQMSLMMDEFEDGYKNITNNVNSINRQIDDIGIENTSINSISKKLTCNLDELASFSTSLSEDSYNISAINLESLDDIRSLNETFLKMEESIREKFIDNIEEIRNKMDNTIKTIDSVESISNNINLLSLNARIEASRSRENGRAFSAVAEAIQNLSIETDKIVADIKRNIEETNLKIINTEKEGKSIKVLMENERKRMKNTYDAVIKANKILQEFMGNIEVLNDNIHIMKGDNDKLTFSIDNISQKIQHTITETNNIIYSLESNTNTLVKTQQAVQNITNNTEIIDENLDKFKI